MNRKFDREKYLASFTVVGEAKNRFAGERNDVTPREALREIVKSVRAHRAANQMINETKPFHLPVSDPAFHAKYEAIAVAALRHFWRFRRLAYAEARR